VELLREYSHIIIKEQISKGIVEQIPESNQHADNIVHYLLHHAAIHWDTTKLQVVAKSNDREVTLDDCLQTLYQTY